MSPHPIPDAALEADIAILGKKGRGKTYTAKGCVERLLDMGRRVIVLDPLSTWWGLKAGPHAYPIAVLGGPHGDLPISDKDGEPLGRYLARAHQSAVIDLGAMRKGELVRFASSFLEELYTANRDPLWLVLEEADVFAPQQPMPDTARLLGEVDRIARRGRQFGFRLITLTQRPAKLNKDVLTQLSTLVALGITSPQDRDAIKAWVEGNADRDAAKDVVSSLASLKVGEGWVWAPDHDILARVQFPPIKTLDTSATPKAGERRAISDVRGDVDVAAIRAALALSEAPSTGFQKSRPQVNQVTDPAALASAERRGYERGIEEGEHRGEARGIAIGIARARAALDAIRVDVPRIAAATTSATARIPPRPKAPLPTGELNSAARKMLLVLDTNPPVRRSWTQVATLAGLKARGGHFNAGRKALLDGALIAEADGLVQIAAPSAAAVMAVIDPAALVELWAGSLSGAAPKILRLLFSAGGSLPRAEVAARLEMQPRGGHWNAAWKELRDNAVVDLQSDVATLTELFRPRGEARKATP